MKKDVMKKLVDMLKADDLGMLPDNTGASNLLKPVADKVIEELQERNILRQIFPTINVPTSTKNLSVPVVTYGTTKNVYTIGYGTDVTGNNEQTFQTKSLVLIPRLLVTYVDVIEDDLEAAGIDLARYLRHALTMKLSQAEESAMFTGVYNAAEGTYANIFNGIYTVGASADCAVSPVTYVPGTDDVIEKIMDAKKALGVYGNDANNLVILCSLTFGNRLRKNSKVHSVDYVPSTRVIESGTLPPILGCKVFETTYLDAVLSGEIAILIRKDAFMLGLRKRVWVKNDEIVEKFTQRIIMAEDLDFKAALLNDNDKYEGMVLIRAAS